MQLLNDCKEHSDVCLTGVVIGIIIILIVILVMRAYHKHKVVAPVTPPAAAVPPTTTTTTTTEHLTDLSAVYNDPAALKDSLLRARMQSDPVNSAVLKPAAEHMRGARNENPKLVSMLYQ